MDNKMWCVYVCLIVVVSAQTINKKAIEEAKAEQRILGNIQPIVVGYVSESLQIANERLEERFSNLEKRYDERIQQIESDAKKGNKGVVFTRWGRKDCPPGNTSVVYSGSAGGSFYDHVGAAAEYVCMPHDPIWGPNKEMYSNENVGYMYGAEYQNPITLFGVSNYAMDVPCTVCLDTHHSTLLMIPGRTECYPGWTEAYHGDLASGRHDYKAASEYVCVDENPQSLAKGLDDDGKLFYGVKAKCGTLPCPPYEDGKFLSCVVCLK
ncbi:short-chain collagen C4-like [Pecten maximus]|uniref:short-chain collagen C4-like n=1 Tax=Pecten maximus TaxID=6579 RepID=UPI0014588779|nr:short-chain collagen C4-like [Pecten maximus]